MTRQSRSRCGWRAASVHSSTKSQGRQAPAAPIRTTCKLWGEATRTHPRAQPRCWAVMPWRTSRSSATPSTRRPRGRRKRPLSHRVTVTSHNTLLDYEWGDGIKTGATAEAGKVSSARGPRTACRSSSATMHEPTRDQEEKDAVALFQWGAAQRPGRAVRSVRRATSSGARSRSSPPPCCCPRRLRRREQAGACRDRHGAAGGPGGNRIRFQRLGTRCCGNKDPDRELAPASCTKIMTALLTLEHVPGPRCRRRCRGCRCPEGRRRLRPGDRIQRARGVYRAAGQRQRRGATLASTSPATRRSSPCS